MLLPTLLSLALAQDPLPAPETAPAQLDEVTVLGRRTPPDPFDIFQAVCFDANRMDRRAFRPEGAPRWSRLQPDTTGPGDGPAAETFIRRDGDLEMVLRIQEGPDRKIDRVQRNVCSLTLAGPHDQSSLVRGMSRAMGGGGTSRHLSVAEIYPTFPGWTQLLWAAMPNRNTSNWRVLLGEDRQQSAVLMVARPSFYRQYSYVVTELRFTDQESRPVSHISLTFITRTQDD